MNRPNFIATVAATLAAASLPQAPAIAADATQVVEPIVYTTPMKMWKFNGSYPIVFANTAEEAISWAISEGCDVDPAHDYPVMMPASESVTLIYEDGVPEHLQADEDCECTQEELEDDFGCDCGPDAKQVTMFAADWAVDREARGSRVILEYGTF